MENYSVYNFQKDFLNAFNIINKSRGTPSPLLVGVYGTIGDILNNKGLDADALNYYLKTLKLLSQLQGITKCIKRSQKVNYVYYNTRLIK